MSDAWTYDAYGAPASYAAGALYSEQISARDELGRITQRTETVNGTSHAYAYTYNTAGQLAGVSLDGSAAAAYTYDLNGNRLTAQGAAIGTKTLFKIS